MIGSEKKSMKQSQRTAFRVFDLCHFIFLIWHFLKMGVLLVNKNYYYIVGFDWTTNDGVLALIVKATYAANH